MERGLVFGRASLPNLCKVWPLAVVVGGHSDRSLCVWEFLVEPWNSYLPVILIWCCMSDTLAVFVHHNRFIDDLFKSDQSAVYRFGGCETVALKRCCFHDVTSEKVFCIRPTLELETVSSLIFLFNV